MSLRHAFGFDKRKDNIWAYSSYILVLVILILHLVFWLIIDIPELNNIFDTFNSSPLFNFRISDNCGMDDHIIFHVWEGRKESYYSNKRYRTRIVDATYITKINGYLFCYKKITYKELLNNGQIIKKGEKCGLNFPKNCGIIDTLEQELCIKNEEKCPLYDVGIGSQIDLDNYEYDSNSNIYYNKENFEKENKKIIGRIILNDGQPCYNKEKLWRKFVSEEAADTNLKCDVSVFGKLTDDRFENKGSISYKKIYEDNLSSYNSNLIIDKIKDEKVSLFKRQFLGIDKECDSKSEITQEKYDILNNSQQSVKMLLNSEWVIILFIISISLLFALRDYIKSRYDNDCTQITIVIGLIMHGLLFIASIICYIVFLVRIIKNNFEYNCSDEITNELINQENKNIKKNILYIAINLGADSLFLVYNGIAAIFYYKWEDIEDYFRFRN